MEGGISWGTILIIAIFFGTLWFITRDDKKPRKTTQTSVQEINLNVNVRIDRESLDLLREIAGRIRNEDLGHGRENQTASVEKT